MARNGPIAANTAIAAATKNNEQNIRCCRDGVNVRFGFLVFIGIGLVEVGIILMKGLRVSCVYTGNKRRSSQKWLRRVKIVKWLKR
jgi:hypothetical protein